MHCYWYINLSCLLVVVGFFVYIFMCVFFTSDNIKALFRRAKAYAGAWDVEEARADFDRVMELDPKLSSSVKKELKHIDDIIKEKEKQEMNSLKGMFN